MNSVLTIKIPLAFCGRISVKIFISKLYQHIVLQQAAKYFILKGQIGCLLFNFGVPKLWTPVVKRHSHVHITQVTSSLHRMEEEAIEHSGAEPADSEEGRGLVWSVLHKDSAVIVD